MGSPGSYAALGPGAAERRHRVEAVKTGLSDLDNIEVLDGLAEGDTVVYTLVSGAMQARDEFRERMRDRNAVPGLRGGN